MSKLTILMCLTCFSAMVFLSACSSQPDGKMLNYQRKFQNLGKSENRPAQKQTSYGVIDLSDGNKLNYDSPFGPSFDIK